MCTVKPHHSNFRIITQFFAVYRTVLAFMVIIIAFISFFPPIDLNLRGGQQTSSDYRNDPKYLGRLLLDQGLHCLQFHLHLLDSMAEPHCSNFRIITAIFQMSEYLGILQYGLCISDHSSTHSILNWTAI